MSASYPDGVKTWTPRVDGVDDVMAADINSVYEEVTALETYAIPNNGDASDVTAAFTQASTRANLTSGEKLKISLGKLMKWFADLKTVAFSGSYSDLSDKPEIVDNLSSTSATGALSANQGRVLNELVSTKASFKNGSGTFPAGTTHTVTDAFITASTLVTISPTAEKQGVWSVNSADGSFTITSDATETTGVTFDWGAVK